MLTHTFSHLSSSSPIYLPAHQRVKKLHHYAQDFKLNYNTTKNNIELIQSKESNSLFNLSNLSSGERVSNGIIDPVLILNVERIK